MAQEMLIKLVFVLLLTKPCLSEVSPVRVKKPWPLPSSPKIFGGDVADACSYPFQVMLLYDGWASCGGSIINEWTILTAAHCVYDDQRLDMYSVRAGEQFVFYDVGHKQTRQLSSIIIHQDYDAANVVNDVAILHVDEPFTFNYCVQAVQLSDAEFDEKAIALSCDTSGFGTIDNHGTAPNTLLSAQVKVVKNEKCNRNLHMKGFLPVPGTNICTMNRKKGTCRGDSGGPMGCYDDDGVYRQVGVTSWGPFNCNKPPNVFARVSSYLEWIDYNTVWF